MYLNGHEFAKVHSTRLNAIGVVSDTITMLPYTGNKYFDTPSWLQKLLFEVLNLIDIFELLADSFVQHLQNETLWFVEAYFFVNKLV